MLVSVIICCYNHEKYVKEAIDSVLNQTYKNIEIVIVNDASTDNSSKVIREIASQYKNIIFIDQKNNKGIVYSRNLAIQHSNGKYILPLDSDDKIAPSYIEKAVSIFEKDSIHKSNNKIGMVYCEAEYFGTKSGKWELPEFNLPEMLWNNCIFNCALFRKKDWKKVGGYKEYMKNGKEDYDLWLSFLEQGLFPYKIKETLFFYRKHNETSRSDIAKKYNKNKQLQKELIRHHIDLYINDKEFIFRVFQSKKYKKKFNIALIIIFIEFIIFFLILSFKFF